MFELCLLGFLNQKGSYRYELKKQLAELIIFRRSISDGTLYPVIKRLINKGFVVETVHEGERQKLLSITDSGRERFLDLLHHPSDEDIANFNKFYGYVHFMASMDKEVRVQLLEARLDFISECLPLYMRDGQANSPKDTANELSGAAHYYMHHSELLAESFYKAETVQLTVMIQDIKKGRIE